ncbi:MAG: endonuclease/exonuclease/phosphatase family protein [Candidatus Sulfotelmatobacter sp.]
MKVAIFNINKRLDNLLAWLAKAEPDVVSLQELKAEQQAFPVNALRTLGYEAVWQGERSWNGVAILARNHVPVLTCTSLPGNPEDHQARYIEAAVQGVLITSIYLPNGNPQPGPKFNYKLAWFERLIAHAAELMASGAPGVLAGDYMGLGRIGFHTFRHTYRAWLDETGAPVGVQQKLMRHAHVSTTMDQYGNASALAKRKANRPIVQRLLQRPANQKVSIQ